MKNSQMMRAKIVQHGEGMGVPNPDLVRKRAGEIARIAGRRETSDEDWRQAKIELHGGHFQHLDDGEDQMIGTATEREVPGTLGHHVENMRQEDADNVLEELVAEGMDEAEHERMLAASRMNDGEDSEEEED